MSKSLRAFWMARTTIGIALASGVTGILVAAMIPLREHIGIATAGLVLIVPVVLGVIAGGFLAGVISVAVGFFVYVFVFIPPYYTLFVGRGTNWIPVGVYVAVVLPVAWVVSGRNAARSHLHKQVSDYRRLAENASDVVFEIDADRTLLWISPSMERAMGWSPATLLGTSCLGLINDHDIPLVEEAFRQVFGLGQTAELECQFHLRSGDDHWFSVRSQPVADERGNVNSGVIGLRDAHAEVVTRRALQTISAGHAALFQVDEELALLQAMCRGAVEAGGYVLSWYCRLARGSGTDVEIVAASPSDHPLVKEAAISVDRGPFRSGATTAVLSTGSTYALREDSASDEIKRIGDRHNMRSVLAIPVHVDGVLDGALAVTAGEVHAFDDETVKAFENLAGELGNGISRIRGRARLDAALIERDRARREQEEAAQHLARIERLETVGQLAGGVAHDFNNLLTVVLSYAALITKESEGDKTESQRSANIRDYTEKIVSASEKAAELIHQLLTFARRQPAMPTNLDINEVVRETDELLQRVISSRISIATSLAPDLKTAQVDPGRLGEVLMNLVVNARDAMPDGGTITIVTDNLTTDPAPGSSDAVSQFVRLRVSDTGVGMPPEVIDRAFEPFFTTKPSDRGTGLGLASVYGIVSQAHGSISLTSEVGVGTTVELLFPAAELASAT